MRNTIIVNFGYRSYLFFSQEDITKARDIYAHNTGDLNSFEDELKQNKIEFDWVLGYGKRA